MRDSCEIILARERWRERLMEMWEEAFGDSREQIRLFHAYFPPEKYAWCLTENDRPLSVIYALPAYKWEADGGKRDVWYLYAGATGMADRGKGYYGELMRSVCAAAPEGGNGAVAKVLVPVRDLIRYYEKLGFSLLENTENWMSLPQSGGMEARVYGTETIGCSDITPTRYKELRDMKFGGPGYVEWGISYLGYALESLRHEGGRAVEVSIEGEPHILMGRVAEDCLNITETSLSTEQLLRVGEALKGIFGCGRIQRKGTVLMGYGQRWQETPYFKIALDD